VTGQRHHIPLGVHRDVAVVGDQRPPVQRVLNQDVNVELIRVLGERDLRPAKTQQKISGRLTSEDNTRAG
jgi:hypothetical protein